MKKLAALLAALILCFALCISAAAYNASEILNTSNASTGTMEAAYGKTTVTAEVYPAGTTFSADKDVPGKYFSEFQVYDDAENYVGYYFSSSAFTLPDDGKVYRLSVFDGSSFVFYDTYVTAGTAAAEPEAPAVPETPAEPVEAFTDITEGETFYDAIAYVTKQGLMDGATDTAFERKAAATNKAVLATVDKLDGADAAKEWAAQKGLADDAEATREDLVTMLWIAGGKKTADESVLNKFADADAISAEAKTAMAWAVETGLVQGYAHGLLGAQSQLTRGAMAAILFRAAA